MRFVIMIIFLMIPAVVVADIIDFECKIKRYGELYDKFLKESKNDSTSDAAKHLRPPVQSKRWWEFMFYNNFDEIKYFSIDVTNKKILSFTSPYLLDLEPDRINIIEYWNCTEKEIHSCKDKIFQYHINRISGKITGIRMAVDNSWAPYFKYGNMIYSFSGYCQPIKRKF